MNLAWLAKKSRPNESPAEAMCRLAADRNRMVDPLQAVVADAIDTSAAMDQVFGDWVDGQTSHPADPPPKPEYTSSPPEPTLPIGLNLADAGTVLTGILAVIRDERHREALQAVLSALSGQGFDTFESNVEIVSQVNAVARALDVGLKLRETGESVRIRCVKPPRSKRGSIQARSADRSQRALFTGDAFPDLEVS